MTYKMRTLHHYNTVHRSRKIRHCSILTVEQYIINPDY